MKHWCFTLNNYTDTEWKRLENILDIASYAILGKEVGDSGTPHIQGYVVLKKRYYLTGVRKILGRAHWEPKVKKSTYKQCIVYCKKDGDFTELGIAPIALSQRNKRKWSEAFNLAKEGKVNEIDHGMLVRYYHAFKRIEQDNPDVPEELSSHQNYWIVAPTGYGKSRYARRKFPDYFDKPPNKWFIGYKGQKTLLLDDYGPKECEYLGWYMKRWADLYAFPMETKGGGHVIRPQNIVVTSQHSIEECFPDSLICQAIKRRFTVVNLPHFKRRINFDI